jgi:hypothetical protein
MAGDKGAYWWHEYAKHEMGLQTPCLKQVMVCFTEASKVDTELTTWDPATWEVENKWIDQTGQYYDDAAAQMDAVGIDIEAGITHPTVQGVDEVKKLENSEMIRDTLAAEGIREDQDTRNTHAGGALACTGVSGGVSTTGTFAKAFAQMSARETVAQE